MDLEAILDSSCMESGLCQNKVGCGLLTFAL